MSDVEIARELVLVDEFPTEPSRVWSAWTAPDEFVQWWRAPGWVTEDVTFELAPRGRFAARQRAMDGSADMAFGGFVRVAEKPHRLVFTLSDAESPDDPARTQLSVELQPVAGGTRQTFTQSGTITQEHYDALEAGTRTFFTQLREHLLETSADAAEEN